MAQSKKQAKTATRNSGRLRIISGRWRGEYLNVTELEGLRPTPSRTRETVFNWLQQSVADSRCLDLFAGTGAMGLEALSRHAAHVDFIELAAPAAAQIQTFLVRKQATTQAQVQQINALHWLEQPPVQPYDIVFLDPPFQQQLLEQSLTKLSAWLQVGGLRPNSKIYLELARQENLSLPPQWHILRSGKTRETQYHLITPNALASSTPPNSETTQ